MPLALEAESLNHWTTRDVPPVTFCTEKGGCLYVAPRPIRAWYTKAVSNMCYVHPPQHHSDRGPWLWLWLCDVVGQERGSSDLDCDMGGRLKWSCPY